jgi:predicted nucleic acid-binding protein
MMELLADTSYWMALVNPRDELHSKARSVSREFASARVITSEMILTELLNGFSEGGPWLRGGAARAVEALRGNPSVRIVPQTTEQFRNAVKLYEQLKDKSWSLTDCASFQIMKEHGIRAALTHDVHFAQAGFEALLR